LLVLIFYINDRFLLMKRILVILLLTYFTAYTFHISSTRFCPTCYFLVSNITNTSCLSN